MNILTIITLAALLLTPLVRMCAADTPTPVGKPVFRGYVDYVRPWIGSKTGRWFQTVSATRPFGMVGITPDTELGSRHSGCGYVYEKPNIFDLHSELSEADQVDAEVTKVRDTEIEGWVRLKANCEFPGGDVGKVYFVARFSKAFESLRAWKSADLGSVSSAAGHPLVVYPRFPVKRGDVLSMKIGLSFCSAGQARKNLDVEIGTRDFQAIHDESRAEWNEWLGKVQVTGGTEDQRIKFYTDVWHSLFGRQPEHRIPWGNVNGGHSWIMMGCERTPLICRAVQMGMTGFDVQKAYTDWVLAQFAQKLGRSDDYAAFMKRSENWKNLWDGQYIRPRYRDGRWAEFDPLVGRNRGYCEANAEQYSFFTVQDVPGVAKLMGGFAREFQFIFSEITNMQRNAL